MAREQIQPLSLVTDNSLQQYIDVAPCLDSPVLSDSAACEQMQPPSPVTDSTVRQYIVTSMGVGGVVPGQNATTNPQSVSQQSSLNMANGIMVRLQHTGHNMRIKQIAGYFMCSH